VIYTFIKDTLLRKITDEIFALNIEGVSGVSCSEGTVYVESSVDLLLEDVSRIEQTVNAHDPLDAEYLREEIPDVTPRQFRQALVLTGLITVAQVEAAIASQSEPLRSLALIEWEYSTMFKRNNPIVNQMAPALGLTAEQIDQVWLLAGTL